MKDMKKKADIWFEIAEVIRKGRRVIGWKFNIYKREQKNIENERLKIEKEQKNFSPELEKLTNRLMQTHQLGEKQARKVVQAVRKNK